MSLVVEHCRLKPDLEWIKERKAEEKFGTMNLITGIGR